MALLGSMVASVLREHLPADAGHGMFGHFFLERFIAVHVNNFTSKHNVLMLMARKLCSFACGNCSEDNVDSISHQELLLPGHLLGAFIREKCYKVRCVSKNNSFGVYLKILGNEILHTVKSRVLTRVTN